MPVCGRQLARPAAELPPLQHAGADDHDRADGDDPAAALAEV